MKRIIVVLTVVLMIFQCLPFAALASDEDGLNSHNVSLTALESYVDSLTAEAEKQIFQIDEYFTELGDLAEEFDNALSVFETDLFSLSWAGKELIKEEQETLIEYGQNVSSVVIEGINTRRDSQFILLNVITPEADDMTTSEYNIYNEIYDSLASYFGDLVERVTEIDGQLQQEMKDALKDDGILVVEEFKSINGIVEKLKAIQANIAVSEPKTAREELTEWVEIYKKQASYEYDDESDSDVALAETEVEKDTPILFRDIEWGASLPEALDGMPEGVKFFNIEPGTSVTVYGEMFDTHNFHLDGDIIGYVSAMSSSLEGIKIAGYELSGIIMRFAFVPDEDGLLIQDDQHTKLYFAQYKLSPKDLDAAYADLTEKLSSLYGEPDSVTSENYLVDKNYTAWEGADNTILVLYSEVYPSGSKYIEIRYGTLDGDEWMQQAYDALIKQESIDAVSNIDGL